MHARITGWGKYLPQKVLTNQDLERMIHTSDEWIMARTGIRERRIAADDETTSTMAIEAGRKALEVAQLPPSALDLVIVATNTPETTSPGSSAQVQDGLGTGYIPAFDVGAGCSGFLYGLVIAYQFIGMGVYRNILVAGSEVMSRMLDWKDRNTCVLFGDGAGAVVVQANEQVTDMLSFVLGNDGSGVKWVGVPGICAAPAKLPQDGRYCVYMDGRQVFRFAVTAMTEMTKQAVETAGLRLDDLDLWIPHQANQRIIDSATKSLGFPQEKVFVNLDRYGNTSAASPAIALCDAIEQGWVKNGDHLALTTFGAGLSWAAVVLKWQPRA